MPTLCITAAPFPNTYAVTLIHTPGATMPVSPLAEIRNRFTNEATRKRALAKAHEDAAAQLRADADADDAFVNNLETFVMENATELVNEAVEKIKAEEAEADALQKANDALTKENADLKARAVDQPTLDALNTILHPAPPVEPTPPTP